MIEWMRSSLKFNLFCLAFTVFNTFQIILSGHMTWLLFIVQSVCLYLFLSAVMRLWGKPKEEEKEDE